MTSTLTTRLLAAVAIPATAVMLILALWVSPPDVVQGDAVRMLYIHVPSIWVAYGSFALAWVASALLLWRGGRRADGGSHYDRLAGAAAEVGVLFTVLTLFSGSLWGRVTWGTYWQWDARLTTTVMLLLTYIGYLALRRLPSSGVLSGAGSAGANSAGANSGVTNSGGAIQHRRAAIMALISFVNVPIVHYSVDWWRTLHQDASLTIGRQPEITGEMYWTLLYSTLTVTVVAAWLIVHRYRLLRLHAMADDVQLSALLLERRSEGAML